MKDEYIHRVLRARIELMDYSAEQKQLHNHGYPEKLWCITWVWTPILHRRQGAATKLMREVCADADREWVHLCLVVAGNKPCPQDPCLSDDELIKWYSTFGFELWDGANSMMRRPVVHS